MLNYIKERMMLDFNFLIDYWWIFVIIILILFVSILIDNFKNNVK